MQSVLSVLDAAEQTREAALAAAWSLDDAEALLKIAPTVVHVDLCVQSLLIDTITQYRHVDDADEVQDALAFPLGRIASWSSMALLDQVLTRHIPWLRVLELAWIHDSRGLMFHLMRDVLPTHPLTKAILAGLSHESPELTGPYALATIVWWFDFDADGVIHFPVVPRVNQPCHPSVLKFFDVSPPPQSKPPITEEEDAAVSVHVRPGDDGAEHGEGSHRADRHLEDRSRRHEAD